MSLLILLIAGAVACEKILSKAPADDELLDGPVEGLTNEQNAIFLLGDIAFNDKVFTPETGLGPLFVASSCGTCHAGDGKGHPFTMLTRFGQTDGTGNQFLDRVPFSTCSAAMEHLPLKNRRRYLPIRPSLFPIPKALTAGTRPLKAK